MRKGMCVSSQSIPGQDLKLPLFQLWWPLVGTIHLGLHVLGNRLLPKLIPQHIYLRFVNGDVSPQKAVSVLKRDGLVILSALFTASSSGDSCSCRYPRSIHSVAHPEAHHAHSALCTV